MFQYRLHASTLTRTREGTKLFTYLFRTIKYYAPTELAETPVKDAFYAALDSTLEALPSHRLTLVLGDLNAKGRHS